MQHIQGTDRNQLSMYSLESMVPEDSFVRVIDAFVDAIDLKSFGFNHVEKNYEGRPAYHPGVLLKLYIYGYRYGIRSSRQLEREARLNIEARWLLSERCPKYHTIADFRKQHSEAFDNIFRKYVGLLKQLGLVEGKTIAIDSFKIRAQNSLKNNFNDKKLDFHLEYIDKKIKEYKDLLDASDSAETRQELGKKIERQKEKKKKYETIKTELSAKGEDQISTTDPDARAVILHRNIVNVGYNVQASVDAKNKLLLASGTGDVNDTHALAAMAIETKALIGEEKMDVIADKGYHTGKEIKECSDNQITTYVSPRAPSSKDENLYPVSSFIYDNEKKVYICPSGSTLRTNGVWYQHSDTNRSHKGSYRFQRYQTTDCKHCDKREKCTTSKKNGRAIDRSEYADALEANTQRVTDNPDYYKQRQQIIEHVFGTLKRQRGFTHVLVKGKEKVLGEVGLMFTCYNLSRCISILGIKEFIKILRDSCSRSKNALNNSILGLFNELLFWVIIYKNQKSGFFYPITFA